MRSSRLPAEFDGLRVTLVTDVHGTQLGENSENLLAAVKDAEPDLICIGGDLVDLSTKREMVPVLLRGLAAIAPTYYVTGNHEWRLDDTEQVLDQIADCGVTVLRNDYLVLGDGMVLAGVEDPNGYADMEKPHAFLERIRREVPGDPYILTLSHRNDRMAQWAALDADLVLAGHGHGGVVKLPLVGGLFGVDRRLFPDNAEGLYTQGRTTLAVSRGLGGLRLWNRPHLPTVVLKTEAQP